jgi:hypothetical protein
MHSRSHLALHHFFQYKVRVKSQMCLILAVLVLDHRLTRSNPEAGLTAAVLPLASVAVALANFRLKPEPPSAKY